MDQIKIGKFIQERRKEKGLTQSELSEKLNISNKTVSKWETGNGLPEVSLMLPLCSLLGISVNELLSGEKIVSANNEQKNEQLLLNLTNELEQKNKIIWQSMWVIMIASMIALFGGLLISRFLIPEGPWQLVAIIAICVLFLIPCFYALKLEVSVGAYKCKHCGHEFTPTYSEALNAMHAGTTRYLKCPNCQKRSWCKKIVK